jgi:hypothetical protein
MPDDQPYDVYRERLSSLYHGYALWEPAPVEDLYEKVSIGDVGYVYNGFFYRMFNITLPWSNLSNQRFGATEPENYEPMKMEEFKNINKSRLAKGDYYSPDVTSQKNIDNQFAQVPREYIVLHSRPRQSELTQILAVPKVLRIDAKVPGHCCLFLTTAIEKKSCAQRHLRTIYETMLSAGSTGRRIKNYPSTPWKTSFSSRGIHWSTHGLQLHSLAALGLQKFP